MNIQIKIEYKGKEYLSDKGNCTVEEYKEFEKTMGQPDSSERRQPNK